MKLGCLIAICIFFIIAGFLASANLLFIIVPAAILLFIIVSKHYKKISEKYTDSINEAIGESNYEKLFEIFNEITQKYKFNKNIKIAFKNTYGHFLSQIFSSDFPNKKELLFFYESNMDNEVFSSQSRNFIDKIFTVLYDPANMKEENFQNLNEKIFSFFDDIEIHNYAKLKSSRTKKDIADKLISNMLNTKQPTEEDFNYIYKILSDLNVDSDVRNHVDENLVPIKRIIDLHKNGLQPLEIHNPITAQKDCFYYGNINILKNRQKDGQKFFEQDKIGEIYILNDEIDIIADGGHKKIKMSEIISVNFENGILQLTILNRSTPLGLSSEEPEYVLEILNMVRDVPKNAS